MADWLAWQWERKVWWWNFWDNVVLFAVPLAFVAFVAAVCLWALRG